MSKCGSCGQFMAKEKKDGVSCTRCSVVFHRTCMKISETGKVSPTWTCNSCKTRQPAKTDKSNTPVKGPGDDLEPPNQDKSEPDNLAQEIRLLRNELKGTRAEMQEGLRDVRSEIAEFKTSLSSYTDRLDAMELRLTCLEKKFEEKGFETNTDAVQDTIFELKTQLNEREQENLLNDVEISGIPEGKEVTPLHLVKTLSAKLGVNIEERDIVHVERSGPLRQNRLEDGGTGGGVTPAPRPRPITVRLTRRCTRDQLIRAARVRRSITTADLDLAGAPRRVYVNERLTRQNRQLFYRAREEARRQGYKYVWTRDGKIFARKDDGKPAERIRSEKDMSRVFG